MPNLPQIETDLQAALKSRDSLRVDTLRGLKTRIQNEAIAKMKELQEAEVAALVRSEIKRRRDAAEAFTKGGRAELAQKELAEAAVLQDYLPPQLSHSELEEAVARAAQGASAVDFGRLMGRLKAELGDRADGAELAKLLKEKLN